MTSSFLHFIDNNTPSITGLLATLDILKNRVPEEEQKKIRAARVFLFYSEGPGCITKFRFKETEGQINRLIVIDKTLTRELLKFDPTEIGAEIMHEIGHYLNKEPKDQGASCEFFADDYARRLGFSASLGSGLKKYILLIERMEQQGILFFREKEKQDKILELLRVRIERIKTSAPLFTGALDLE